MSEGRGRPTSWTAAEDAILSQYYPLEGKKVCERLPGRTLAACRGRARYLGMHLSASCKAMAYAAGRRCREDIWTQEENDILHKYFPIEGRKVYKRLPGRTSVACAAQAHKRGIVYGRTDWTEAEDAIVRQYYPIEGGAVYKRLQGRSADACKTRARHLKLQVLYAPWSEKEDNILRRYFPVESSKVCARLPKRTEAACVTRARLLGLWVDNVCVERRNRWTQTEDDILRQHYQTDGVNVCRRLPGRTVSACTVRAGKLGLSAKRPVQKKWTLEEDAILRNYYSTENGGVYKRLPGRTKKACTRRAQKLGLMRHIRGRFKLNKEEKP